MSQKGHCVWVLHAIKGQSQSWLRADFYPFYDVIVAIVLLEHKSRTNLNLLFYLNVIYQKRIDLLGLLSLSCLTFQIFQPDQLFSSCLGFDLNLGFRPQQLSCLLKKQCLFFVFSRSKWNVKIQRRNECIMFFKHTSEWRKLFAT